jgi:hypothetical protein
MLAAWTSAAAFWHNASTLHCSPVSTHLHAVQAPVDDLVESADDIASQFNGTCKRLGAGQAAYVYWQSGGLTLGLISLFIFAFTQATRIMGDWWIRCVEQ